MKFWLYISSFCDDDPVRRLSWWQNDYVLRHGTLEEAARELGGQPVTLLLPMELCSYHTVSIPRQAGRWWREALNCVLEEQLAERIELLHLAHCGLQDKQHCKVWVIKRTDLQIRLDHLAKHGITVQRIHVDADCIPHNGSGRLKWDSRWLIGGHSPIRLALSDDEVDQLADHLPLVPPCEPLSSSACEVLTHGTLEAIDLCQGDFQYRRARLSSRKTIALTLLLGCGAFFTQAVVHLAILKHHTQAQRQVNSELWQRHFTSDPQPLSLQAAINRNTPAPSTLVRTLASLTLDWLNSQGATTEIRHLGYQPEAGFSLEVHAPGFTDLEHLREDLTRDGYTVETHSSTRDASGVTARISIRENT
ncbi:MULTISPECIES: type II secretion system protein GspL [Pseudomonas]|uniref:type II secretion system protein GspL n=1 Tax=Pseudomonas TaxID=286 RepID=UPI0009CCF655|nr:MULTISPECIES: type II secretion system protein GspL [Pseudomonas]OPB05914.1 hypothetical protein BFW89_09865 [Pseudomonas synxantha]VCU67848.1 Type II secretion system protein L [Pseudomonas synxantha]